MMDLTYRGFSGSLSGDSFCCLHGDLITEIFNGQTKRQAGSHCAGFSKILLRLTHGLLHLIFIQKFGKLFRIKYN